jgi:Fe-S-cluster containining protein
VPTKPCTHCGKPISANQDYCRACLETIPDRFRELDELYRLVPNVKCKGLCTEQCANVPITSIESCRIEQATGYKCPVVPHPLPDHPGWTGMYRTLGPNLDAQGNITTKINWMLREHVHCHFLKAGRCTIYDFRPLICRLYGHPVAAMACEHGCEVEGEWTEAQVNELLRKIRSL